MNKRFLTGRLAASVFTGALACASAAQAADEEVRSILIEDHYFTPEVVKVPANKRIKLRVVNRDAGAEEFESKMLKVEKIIPPRGTAVIFIGPLAPGKYPFYGEFHQSTAQGAVVAE
jgi:hypothetical protein